MSDLVPVKGRLQQRKQFWEGISTSNFILSIIDEGYRIPFQKLSPRMLNTNNRSVLQEYQFVTETVLELLHSGRVTEKHEPSYVVSPLSVSVQASGKRSLILDLSR